MKQYPIFSFHYYNLFESQKTFTYQWDGLCNDGYKISSGIYTYIIRSKDDFYTGKISYIE